MNAPAVNFECRISEGIDGVKETLTIMRRVVRAYKKSPELIALAHIITNFVPFKNVKQEAIALFNYVRSNIRYVMDPVDVELVMTPDRLIEMGSGDCDDMATLLATLLECIGIRSRFVAVGFTPGELSHVYVEGLIGDYAETADGWYALDVTEPNPPGWKPSGVKNLFRVHNS